MADKKNSKKKPAKKKAAKKQKQKSPSSQLERNTIHQGDCIELMQQLPDGSVDLTFADPPFNIGYKYDIYDDRKSVDDYLEWSKSWIGEVHRILKDDGAFWLAIGDDFAAELKVLCHQLGFHPRNWVIWYYTFGVHCETKFTRSHTHLLYFVKNPKQFTFNRDAIAVPSARQLVYNDSRANPNGRVPDDTWILRPQDCQDGFTPDEDCWYFPRVAGTFKERAGFHGCQMPEQLLGRIIRCCSRAGELVFDPFSGSASTSVVAKKLHRNFMAFELSEEYTKKGGERIEAVESGDPLDGAEEPKLSAPVTYPVRGRSDKSSNKPPSVHTDKIMKESFENELLAAFAEVHQGLSSDRVVLDPKFNQPFLDVCRRRGLEGFPHELNRYLFRLRKQGKFAGIKTSEITKYSWGKLDQFIDASEIAWNLMTKRHGISLDEIFCDPLLASEFDEIANEFAPGFEPIDYRWGAITVRKESKDARLRADKIIRQRNTTKIKQTKAQKIESIDLDMLDFAPQLYRISDGPKQLYVGETLNLRKRLERSYLGNNSARGAWDNFGSSLMIRFTEFDLGSITPGKLPTELLGYQSLMIDQYTPQLNALNQTAS